MSITEAITIEVALALTAAILIGGFYLQFSSKITIGQKRIRTPRQHRLTKTIVEREPAIEASGRIRMTDDEWNISKNLLILCNHLHRENFILTSIVEMSHTTKANADAMVIDAFALETEQSTN